MTEAPILFSENWVYALLLAAIKEACGTMTDGEINSWGRAAYARAIRDLDQSDFVEIQKEDGDNIVATISEKGNAHLVQLLKEEAEEKAARKR